MSASSRVTFTVFTKPWKMPVADLARHVARLGFEGVELPVRPGFPVNPDNVAEELPRAARIMADAGLAMASIAGPTDEKTIAACAAAGVPIIRICTGPAPGESYMRAMDRLARELEALVPALDRCRVTVGIQNHVGRYICDAMGLRFLIERFDRRHVAAVWDAAHNALAGEEPDYALDIIWDRLCMVNLKNAFWVRANGPEADCAKWKLHWTTGPHGLASWPRVAAELNARGYRGVVCLTAEYSEEHAVDRLAAADLGYARTLFAQAARPGAAPH